MTLTLSLDANAIDLGIIRQVNQHAVRIGPQLFRAVNIQVGGFPKPDPIDPSNTYPVYFEIEGANFWYTVAGYHDRVEVEVLQRVGPGFKTIKTVNYHTHVDFIIFVISVLAPDYRRAQKK